MLFRSVSRINVDGPYYDGPDGYTVFKIREKGGISPTKDILTVMTAGQFRLVAADLTSQQLYALRVQQYGAGQKITNISKIQTDQPNVEDVIPKEHKIYARYAALTPDSHYCLLFGDDVVAVELASGTVHKIEVDYEFPYDAAEPETPGGTGWNLSGEYMNLTWKSDRKGTVTLSNKQGDVYAEVPIKITFIESQ